MNSPNRLLATSRTVSFKRPDGRENTGYLASPANPTNSPAVVVIQEWWGLNEQIRRVADRLAACGYLALVPDLYRGETTVEEEEAHHLMDNLNFADAVNQDIRGAVNFLLEYSQNIGVTGFCLGGALTLLSLKAIPEFSAGVIFYGMPPLEYLGSTPIKGPVQAHWAMQDIFFPTEGVDALESLLVKEGTDIEFHRYLAHHAFANEEAVGPGRIPGTQYDPVWSQLAWDRTLTFFGRTLWS